VPVPYKYRRPIPCVSLACSALLSLLPMLSTAAAPAAPPAADAVDYGALIRDLTLTRNAGSRMSMSMWMPDEFWRAALQSNGKMTDKGINDYIAVMHPYILVAILDAKQGITAFQYADMDTLSNEVTIEDSHGMKYGPLPPNLVAEDVKNLIQVMRPLLSNMMGNMGQHMEFLVFPSMDNAQHPIADPKSEGSLTVHLGDLPLRYRLPLASMLPAAMDAKTGESFPGNFHFNPYTGDKLVARPSAANAGSNPKPQ
jgi:hypothetical protein